MTGEGSRKRHKLIVGWQEWCALPDLALPMIKAKIDTGAKTSALHAMDVHRFRKGKSDWVSFVIHPLQGHLNISKHCKARLIDVRHVVSSNGIPEERCVIESELHLGCKAWMIELTLSNREPMKFRMLLGRQALQGRAIVDSDYRCKLQKIKRAHAEKIYLV